MAANNSVTLIGRFTKDLELKKTTTGKSVVDFTLAVSRSGNKTCDFIYCTAFEKTAESLCRFFNKGNMVGIEGSVRCDSYKDNEGNFKSKTYVVCNSFAFTGSKAEQAQSSEAYATVDADVVQQQNEFTTDADSFVTPDDLPF